MLFENFELKVFLVQLQLTLLNLDYFVRSFIVEEHRSLFHCWSSLTCSSDFSSFFIVDRGACCFMFYKLIKAVSEVVFKVQTY